jgi:LytS/YehU family sensor histidine kinase
VAVQEKNTDIAHSMLLKLSRFLRTTLELDYSDKVRLSDEMSLLSDFIEIEQQRYQGKISINKQVDLQCENAFIPPLILQPLIENAIKFAWQNKYEKYIELSCHKVSEKLIIKITNPISREKYNVKNKGVGIGLKNTASRLSMLYGTKAHVTSITESERFIVTLELPWEEGF